MGIAVGGANDITAEAAGDVFLGQSLEALLKLFEVSRRAVRTFWQNIIIFTGAVNAICYCRPVARQDTVERILDTAPLSDYIPNFNASMKGVAVQGPESVS